MKLDPENPERSIEILKRLEGRVIEAGLTNGFEGGATFHVAGVILLNTKGEHVLKEGRRHVFNFSKYLQGEESSRDKYKKVYSAKVSTTDSL